MPNLAFLMMAGACAAAAYLMERQKPEEEEPDTETVEADIVDAEAARELSWEDVGEADAIALDVGYRLIPLVDKKSGRRIDAQDQRRAQTSVGGTRFSDLPGANSR